MSKKLQPAARTSISSARGAAAGSATQLTRLHQAVDDDRAHLQFLRDRRSDSTPPAAGTSGPSWGRPGTEWSPSPPRGSPRICARSCRRSAIPSRRRAKGCCGSRARSMRTRSWRSRSARRRCSSRRCAKAVCASRRAPTDSTAFAAEFGNPRGPCAARRIRRAAGHGHACGHNLIATSVLGATLALAPARDTARPRAHARHSRRGAWRKN